MTASENTCVICKSSPSFFKLRNKYHIDKCTYCGLEFTNQMPTKKHVSYKLPEFVAVPTNKIYWWQRETLFR